MLTALIIVSAVAAVAFGCWMSAEHDLREAERDLAATEAELQVALGWNQPEMRRTAVVLHGIEGGAAE